MPNHSAVKHATIAGPLPRAASSAPYAAVDQDRPSISWPVASGVLAAVDAVTIFAGGLAAAAASPPMLPVKWRLMALVAAAGAILAVNLMQLLGAYKPTALHYLGASLMPAGGGWLLSLGVVRIIMYVTETTLPPAQKWLMLWFLVGGAALTASRLVFHGLVSRWQREGRLGRVIAVVGAGPVGLRLLRHFVTTRDPERRIIGVYDDRHNRLPGRCMGYPILGTVDDLVNRIRERRVDQVVVALPLSADRRLAEIMNKLSLVPVEVRLCADNFGFQLGAGAGNGVTLLEGLRQPLADWRWIAKAVEDRVLAALILLLIAPLLLVVAVLIKLDSPGPVFFRQQRYGYNNKLFEVFKFRTLHHHATDRNAERLIERNDPRVTRVGAFLRRTTLDELPQFFNVLRGDMSIVGPRPHAISAKAAGLLYRDAVKYYDSRHRVKPGITGWAQINGWRGETRTIEQIRKRVEYDLYYIEHWSIPFDLRIILKTICVGFTGDRAY